MGNVLSYVICYRNFFDKDEKINIPNSIISDIKNENKSFNTIFKNPKENEDSEIRSSKLIELKRKQRKFFFLCLMFF